MQYFFYGTLLDADVRRLVLGASPLRGECASLSGYARVARAGKTYPILIEAAQTVCGCLVRNVTEHERRRMIAFEGTEYREAVLPVRTQEEREVVARVFLPRHAPSVTVPWSYERWRRVDKARFLHTLRMQGLRPQAASAR